MGVLTSKDRRRLDAPTRGALAMKNDWEDIEVPVKLKLAALWTSVMFCYLYADYFGLYVPGALAKMLDGIMEPLGPTTQNMLLGTSLMMAIPSVMIFLSVALRPGASRWLNIVFGTLYSLIILLTMWSWRFYVFFGVIEIALTGLIVWYAWNWPRASKASASS
jgi:uncharacterized protein DUF6326